MPDNVDDIDISDVQGCIFWLPLLLDDWESQLDVLLAFLIFLQSDQMVFEEVLLVMDSAVLA